jgi:hypothetical protein
VIITATMVAMAAVAIYLVDCLVLVERGQGVFEVGCWTRSVTFGSRHYVLRERPVILLNPLTPWRLSLKSAPPLFERTTLGRVSVHQSRALKPIAVLGTVQSVLVFVVTPLLLHYEPGWPFFSAVMTAWLFSIAIAAMLWPYRARMNLTTLSYVNVALSGVICLPLSVNIARKAALALPITLTARQMLRLLPRPSCEAARAALIDQLEEACLEAVDGTEKWVRLRKLLTTLQSESERDNVRA